MPEPMWPVSGESARHHGRLDTRYLRGETAALYGLVRRHKKTGVKEFLCEHSFDMSWETDQARITPNPSRIEDYVQDPKYDMFIINFRKENSGVRDLRRVSKYNDAITFA